MATSAKKKKKKKKSVSDATRRLAALEGRVQAKITALDQKLCDVMSRENAQLKECAYVGAVLQKHVDVLERKAIDAHKRISAIEQARLATPTTPHVISSQREAHGLPLGTVVFNAEGARMIKGADGWEGKGPTGAFSGLSDEYAVGWTIDRVGAGGVYVEADELSLLRALEAALNVGSADALTFARVELEAYRKRVRV